VARVTVGPAPALCGALALLIAVVGAAVADPAPTREDTCYDPPAVPSTVAALKPADAVLTITSPRAGETLSTSGGVLTVDVDYWGPHLVEAGEARSIDEYHLAYLLDIGSMAYIGTLRPIPHCTTRAYTGAATRATFRNVGSGVHTLSVLLVGSNDVAVNPPTVVTVTFMVK
jgi:hypothetical protein